MSATTTNYSSQYVPARDIYVAYAAETGTVTESTDGVTAATMATLPTSFAVCGWMKSTPEVNKGLNNAFGYAVGTPQAAYRKRGARNPEMSMTLQVTHAGVLAQGIRNRTTDVLPRLAFLIGRPGLWTLALRDCGINTISMSGRKNETGEAQEIEAQIQVMSCYTHMLQTPSAPNNGALLAALGTPWFWHDCRNFMVTGNDGNLTNYRRALNGWSYNLNNNLQRKGLRQNWGDNNILSNTNEFLALGNENISGEMGFDDRLQDSLLSAAVESQSWGDITLLLSDVPGVATGGKTLNVTLGSAFPQNTTLAGADAGAQLTSTIPYMAKTLDMAFANPS